MVKKRGYSLQPRFFRPRFLMWSKTRDYRTDGPMAALFNRSPSLGPIAPFKTRPKRFKRSPRLNLRSRLKRGFRLNLGPHFKNAATVKKKKKKSLRKNKMRKSLGCVFISKKRGLRTCLWPRVQNTTLRFVLGRVF